jgi:large subunit ribosomal protein L25
MDTQVGKLTVKVRNESGKGPARRLRAAGEVPGVCYGASASGRIEPLPITVNVKALRAALDPVRKQNTVIDLTVQGAGEGGASGQKLTVLVKDYQVHMIRREVAHVDLLAIDPNKEVTASVPLEFTGKMKGTIDGGQLRIVMRELDVRCKPADIPTKFVVDISPLDLGDVLHVSDIALPAGVTNVTGRDQAVALCAAPEEEKAAATTEAAATDAAAAAAPAAAAGKAAPAAAGKAAPAAAGKAAPAAAGKAAPAAKPAAKK